MTEETPVETERWQPDLQLIDAALVGSQRMRQLPDPDRAWVVAGLKTKGLTAERIADLLHCSLRQVRAIAAEPMTAVCLLYQHEADTFADEMRMSAAEVARLNAALIEAVNTTMRVKAAMAKLIELPTTTDETFRCGCPRSRYNSYVDPKTGATSCREHRRLAVVRHRERRRLRSVS